MLYLRFLILSVSAALVCGCSQEGPESLATVSKAPAGLSAEARASMEAAAKQFAEDVRMGRADSVAERFDLGAFVLGVCQGTGCTATVREDFTKGFQVGLAERPGGLMGEYMSQDVRFLRLVEVDGATEMLFRLWDEVAGIDYLRCAFDKADAESWRIVDVLSYNAGEPFTDSVKRTYLPILSSGERAEELKKQYEPLRAVVDKVDEGDFLGARRALVALSESLREQRYARLLELQVLSGIEDAADDYAAAAERFAADYPDSPSLPLQMLEVHSIRREHEKALLAVDQIDQLLGGDPFLDFLRSGALRGLGRVDEAVAGLRKATQALPAIEELRWALVDAALEGQNFAVVADTLRVLRKDFDCHIGVADLEGAAQYREFLQSEAGKALLEEVGATSAPSPPDSGLSP